MNHVLICPSITVCPTSFGALAALFITVITIWPRRSQLLSFGEQHVSQPRNRRKHQILLQMLTMERDQEIM
jgi:hypothetical protein